MQLLKTMVPAAKHFARLYQTTNNVETQHKIMKIDDEAARKLGVSLSHVGVNTYADIEKAFADLKGAGVDGINIKNDPVLTMHRKQIAELALRYGFALICPDRRFVDPSLVDFDVDDPRVVVPGALMSYGEDFIERYRRAASLVDKVLRGIRPADIPVEESQLLELVINERTVKALGLTIPAAIIPDELIRPAPVRNDSQKPQAKTFAGCLRADRRGK
jgi:putative ABC transport system substrate-binding protein